MLLAALDALKIGSLRVVERTPQLHLEKIDVPADRVQRSPKLVTHHAHELGVGSVGGVRYFPRLSCFGDSCAELFVGQGKLVCELARCVCLVLQLACLGLQGLVAFLEGRKARSGNFTLM
jgi:hypothetical protein